MSYAPKPPSFEQYAACVLMLTIALAVIALTSCQSQPPGGDLWKGIKHMEDNRVRS